jgi:hypothetical protein
MDQNEFNALSDCDKWRCYRDSVDAARITLLEGVVKAARYYLRLRDSASGYQPSEEAYKLVAKSRDKAEEDFRKALAALDQGDGE